jgi:hypothetical protein
MVNGVQLIWRLAVLGVACVLLFSVVSALSSDVIAMSLGVLFGIFAGILGGGLVLVATRSRERRYPSEQPHAPERYLPQMPPIIIIASGQPTAQPIQPAPPSHQIIDGQGSFQLVQREHW